MKHLPLIIIAIIFAMSIFFFTQNAGYQKNETGVKNETSEEPVGEDFTKFNIKDHIEYQLPENWNYMKESSGSASETSESEPYLKNILYSFEGDNNERTESIRLNLEVIKYKQPTERYLDVTQFSDGEMVEINGKPAVRSHYNDRIQGHFLEYRFIHKALPWKIWIQTKDLDSEKTQQEDINYFINSIKLLER